MLDQSSIFLKGCLFTLSQTFPAKFKSTEICPFILLIHALSLLTSSCYIFQVKIECRKEDERDMNTTQVATSVAVK